MLLYALLSLLLFQASILNCIDGWKKCFLIVFLKRVVSTLVGSTVLDMVSSPNDPIYNNDQSIELRLHQPFVD